MAHLVLHLLRGDRINRQEVAVKAPNDPKLSDGGGWRAGCTVGGKAAAEAASVTAGAVRCSAWLEPVMHFPCN